MMSTSSDPTLEYRSALNLEAVAGRSSALAAMFRRLRNVAGLDGLHVLLTGETGTGKSLVARVLHQNGPRSEGPFVEVNCAAIPRELWEAEFFGCARNAYTQAAERPGRFAAADGGTLFLDEIGELAPELQAKLLRVLDDGCYERLGEDRTRRADVHIIAATNRPLAGEMASGRFRSDLFFRLNRYSIRVPSLAERSEDVAELAVRFAERECKSLGLASIPLAFGARSALVRCAWPGNVRQLQSAVAQAVVEAAASQAPAVEWHHFCADSVQLAGGAQNPEGAASAATSEGLSFAEATREFQSQLLAAALEAENGNVTRAARRLDLSRSHFYTLLADARGGELANGVLGGERRCPAHRSAAPRLPAEPALARARH